MTKQLSALRVEFSEKIETLENAKRQLKKEFIGIDNIIDEIIENVRSWYTMNSIQEKPAVICLWGLTGVGKTSLVKRLLELISFEDKTFRFDLGEKEGGMSFRNSLSDLCDNKDSSPIVIILDEFQHSRTIKSGGGREEIENDKNRMVWELIDSGKVSYIDWRRGIWGFEEHIIKLKKLLKAGVKVKNGVVVDGLELYNAESDYTHGKEDAIFFPEDNYDTIIDLAGKVLNLNLKSDVKALLMKMNGDETMTFLFKVLSIGLRPAEKSFTQSLIFILGNIDEAYTMSGDYSADISADDFHKISLKITVPDMKKALRSRYRDEQIARLGNIHIIYPALSRNAYVGIIHLELNRLKVKMKSIFDLNTEFDQSLIDEIYKEGVYPTQGARPLFTTIHQMVKSKISIHVNVILEKQLDIDLLKLSVDNGSLVCRFYKEGQEIHQYSDKITSTLEILRKPKKDEIQAIAAVHESGHAVTSSVLLNAIPETIVSVTADTNSHGFIYVKSEKDYFAKAELIAKVAVHLGGIAAEELIFGENYLTAGGSNDIHKVTSMVMELLKVHGFGTNQINYAMGHAEATSNYHDYRSVEKDAKEIILAGKQLAKETLIKEKKLLLVMSNYLAEHPRMVKEEIQEMVTKYAVSNVEPIVSDNYYRDKLKLQHQTVMILDDVLDKNPLVFNKDK
jgi:hypothetical protein